MKKIFNLIKEKVIQLALFIWSYLKQIWSTIKQISYVHLGYFAFGFSLSATIYGNISAYEALLLFVVLTIILILSYKIFNKKKYRIAWRFKGTTLKQNLDPNKRHGHGQRIYEDLDEAEDIAIGMNKRYPEIHHWAE